MLEDFDRSVPALLICVLRLWHQTVRRVNFPGVALVTSPLRSYTMCNLPCGCSQAS